MFFVYKCWELNQFDWGNFKGNKECGRLTDVNLYNKMVGFGADGAAVNMGSRSGIGVWLNQSQPWITSMHFMEHRLKLAFKEIIKNHDAEVKIITFLNTIYKLSQYLIKSKHVEAMFTRNG